MKKKSFFIIYQLLTAIFCIVVVLSQIISAKNIHLPFLSDFALPAGILTYPLTFLIGDLVTEIYGAKRAKAMIYIAFAMSLFSFVILQMAVILPSKNAEEAETFRKVVDIQGWVVVASLTAYIVAQILDVYLYSKIKTWTKGKFLWLRNNVSTWVSQLIDTLIVSTIFFHFGLGMDMKEVIVPMLFLYMYKVFFSVVNTPLFYLFVYAFRYKEGQNKAISNQLRMVENKNEA